MCVLCGPALPVREEIFTLGELIKVIRKLRNGRAGGIDAIPAEYLKALLSNNTSLQLLLDFLNICWQRREVPTDWHLAQVTAIYKKGRIDLPENYRPISLLNVGYKVFAALVKERLVDAGAE